MAVISGSHFLLKETGYIYNECFEFNTMIYYMYQGITIFFISEGLGKYCPKRIALSSYIF